MHPRLTTLLASLCFAATPMVAQALQVGTTPSGLHYASGGIGQAERQALQAQRQDYSFWLTTAARRSGAYLANVEVRIVDADSGRLVLQHTMDGPWLFVALTPGRYEVRALYQGKDQAQTQRGATQIHAGDHHEMMLYFSDDAEVGEPSAASK